MTFRVNPGPYKKSNRSTLKIMLILAAALAVVWICAVIYSFKIGTPIVEQVLKYNKLHKKEPIEYMNYGIRAILIMIISIVTALVCDTIWTLCAHKKDSKLSLGKELVQNLVYNYSWITAMIFALTLPVYTKFYVVIVGVIFAVIICKNVFGGFGKNVFNPAVMARLLVGLSFASSLSVDPILTNSNLAKAFVDGNGLDAVTGATLTTAFNNTSGWLATSYDSVGQVVTGTIFQGYSMIDLLMGNYFGAMGETFTLVILVLGVILSVLKVINWRTPAFYLGTVALSSFVIALVLGLNNPLSYVVYHLSLGGLMFGAVFMLTDPVTGPTSNFGKAFIGIFAGLMVMIIRIAGGYPEGVAFSIALANFISPAIDYVCNSKSNSKLPVKYSVTFGTIILTVLLTSVVAFNKNGGKEVYAINGIDRVQYETLLKGVSLNKGDSIVENKNYVVQTSSKTLGDLNLNAVNPGMDTSDQTTYYVGAYKLDKNNSLKASYKIVDSNNSEIATIYLVQVSAPIVKYNKDKLNEQEIEAFADNISSCVAVAIKNDGKIYSIGTITEANTAGYANIATDAHNELVGKDVNFANNSDNLVISKSTFSTRIIKGAVVLAYLEAGYTLG